MDVDNHCRSMRIIRIYTCDNLVNLLLSVIIGFPQVLVDIDGIARHSIGVQKGGNKLSDDTVMLSGEDGLK